MKKRSGKSQKRTAKTKRTQERSGRVCAYNLLPINALASANPALVTAAFSAPSARQVLPAQPPHSSGAYPR